MTRRALEAAAKAAGFSVSAAAEHHLHRSLFILNGPTAPVLAAISAAADTLLQTLTPAPERWLEDEDTFVRVVKLVEGGLGLFRPVEAGSPSAVRRTEEEAREEGAHQQAYGQAVLLARLLEITAAPADPLRGRSARERETVMLRYLLGDLASRPALQEFLRLAARAAEHPNEVAEEDSRQLWRVVGHFYAHRDAKEARDAEEEDTEEEETQKRKPQKRKKTQKRSNEE